MSSENIPFITAISQSNFIKKIKLLEQYGVYEYEIESIGHMQVFPL